MPNGKGAKVGDWVEVRPLAEIMTTLDENGALDALPFMPEMAQYAGRRFRIVKSAHKTCDPTGATDLRRMPDAVHLEARCDGRAHDGCEARCLLFWKRAWLRSVDGPADGDGPLPAADTVDLAPLQTATRKTTNAGERRYRCQATEIVGATTALPVSDLRQYFEDVTTRNVPLGLFVSEMVGAYAKAIVGKAFKLARIGGARAGAARPAAAPAASGACKLDLRPGEYVQIRPADEILATLDEARKNLGLSLELEMLRHCGETYRVLARITRIIDERSGKMIKLASDCIALEGLICTGLDNRRRIFCPRGPHLYWREAWLRRANGPAGDLVR